MEKEQRSRKIRKFIELWLSMDASERKDSATFLVESYGFAIIKAMCDIAKEIEERRVSG